MATSLRAALIIIGLGLAGIASAQPAVGDLSGTITLMGGEKITGVIKAAELGVVLGSGLGSMQENHGMLQVKDGEQVIQVPAADLRMAQIEWANTGTDAEPRWSIAKLSLTRNDGTVVSGVPTWTLQYSTMWVVTPEGDRRVEAYPLSLRSFKPENLMARILIGDEPEPVEPEPVTPTEPVVEPTPVEPTPVTLTEPVVEPTPVEPTPVTPTEPVVEPTPVEPAPVTPTEPVVEPTPVEPTPVTPTEPVVEPTPVEPAPVTPTEPVVEPTPVEPTPVTPTEPVVEPTPAAPAVPVPCKLTFAGLTDPAETARVRELIAAQAAGGEVAVTTDAAGLVVMSFTLPDMAALPVLAEAIKTRVGPAGAPQAAFEELSRELSIAFRTVFLQGAVTMTVHFTVTPGSQLFVSQAPGVEAQVDAASISPAGEATLTVQLPRGERSVYARTVLGPVEKCIRLDVLTGETTELTRDQYLAHQ